MSKKRDALTLIISIVLLIAINYNYLDTQFESYLDNSESGIVERVIDGDTIVITPKGVPPNGGNKSSVRLLGINSPEKGEKYSQDSKIFLEENVLNKTVKLEFGKDKFDMYGRKLAYVYINSKNINLESVREGHSNYYFPSGKDKHYDEFTKAWEECLLKEINLCEKPVDYCSPCIKLKEFDYENQKVVLYNNCNFDCSLHNWRIKDEGRKNFVFPNVALGGLSNVNIIVGNKSDEGNTLYWKNEDYVWTSSGDTLFLRDSEGKLVLWKNVPSFE